MAESDPHLLADFWDSQISHLEALDAAATPSQAKRNARIGPTIRPAAGEIQTLVLRHLAEFCGVGASNWMGQFAVGFPIAGELPQKSTFPRKEPKKSIIPRTQLFWSDEARFMGEFPEVRLGNAAALRNEAMGQHTKGWLAHPGPWAIQVNRMTCHRAAIT